MRLRFNFAVLTERNSSLEQLPQTPIAITDGAELTFRSERQVSLPNRERVGLMLLFDVDILNVTLKRIIYDPKGEKLETLVGYADLESVSVAYRIAHFVADLLLVQIGFSRLDDTDTFPTYRGDTDEERESIRGITQEAFRPPEMRYFRCEAADVSPETLKNRWRARDFFYLAAQARRSTDPLEEFLHLYRALECAQSLIKSRQRAGNRRQKRAAKQKPTRDDMAVARMADVKVEVAQKLRELRAACAHGATGSVAVQADVRRLREVKAWLPTLQEIVERAGAGLFRPREEAASSADS